MIQKRAKNKYWESGKRWRTDKSIKAYEDMDFNVYDYIIGDSIFTKDNERTQKAYTTLLTWIRLSSSTQ